MWIDAFKNALSFITIIPAGTWNEHVPLRKVISLFPLVGFVIGIVLFLVGMLFTPISSVFALVVWVLITGAFHLDGLADTCDALAFGRDQEERLGIMKDSHVGTFGVVGIVLVLLFKYATLTEVSPFYWLFPPFLGRYGLVATAYFSESARKEGLGYWVASNTDDSAFWSASFLTFLLSLLGGVKVFFAFLVALLFSRVLSFVFRIKFGGITGDTLGASCELIETVVLAMLAILGG
ncbi:adenosylcobinamide-GDP ribazoletransferase [Thermosulfidibacter takaii ABI70S6]|uniref:Adenosylcobinamide-GDP ribazoletransferase n=1 Tax=Thermosulfidibacter takaii (strain DSM 17441 / JCM 13301 / NBRC 103674 / ABI70S6) TaxID=1298851 RepID=A0A0S3QVK7_THET7|nr:adenosylcobinamide-GDP ribazoletransferase [Thermosulfidibacter takaii]BAT72358.1 adenosylcobinamide-GDP ribazoletransferase [Thermosulfidibacter takaii ABI70S6]